MSRQKNISVNNGTLCFNIMNANEKGNAGSRTRKYQPGRTPAIDRERRSPELWWHSQLTQGTDPAKRAAF